jgi:CRISPR-associated protein Csd1
MNWNPLFPTCLASRQRMTPAYRLGDLFAVLEKIQEEASPGINATIRDRYYGAASSTPVAVFTTLLRLKNAPPRRSSRIAAVRCNLKN